MQHILHILVVVCHLRTIVSYHRARKVEVRHMVEAHIFMRQTVNGVQLDEAAFIATEHRRYMNG